MKRTILLLCMLSLLTAAGCSSAPAADSEAEPQFTIYIEQNTETETAAAATETTAPETTAPTETETTETAAPSSEAATETEPADAGSIIGTWEYENGYRMRFFEGDAAELLLDFSNSMYFEEGILYYDDESYPYIVEDGVVTAEKDGAIFLKMTAEPETDATSLQGRYLLGICDFRALLSPELGGEYYVEINGDELLVAAGAQYSAEDGVLQLIRHGESVDVSYTIDGDLMTVTDSEGITDVLYRVK